MWLSPHNKFSNNISKILENVVKKFCAVKLKEEKIEFDYLVIGAGSAGCVVANRLASNDRFSICLIEAGGKDNLPWIHIPVGYFKTMGNPRTDWCYKTQPDTGLNGRSINWPGERHWEAAVQ